MAQILSVPSKCVYVYIYIYFFFFYSSFFVFFGGGGGPNPGQGILFFFLYLFRVSGPGRFCALYEPDRIASLRLDFSLGVSKRENS